MIESTSQAPDLLTIVDPKHVPDPKGRDSRRKNFADNDETVGKALAWIKQYKETFESQSARSTFIKEMDIADEMCRAAATAPQLQSDQSQNVDDTKSNVTSVSFYNSLRAIVSGETAVILGNEEELPMVYESVPGVTDYRDDEARVISESQNAVLRYCWDKDNMTPKVADTLFFGAKYANVLMTMGWDRLEQEGTEIVPKRTLIDKMRERITGEVKPPSKWATQTKMRRVKNNPTFNMRDIRNCWFDTSIDSTQKQSCIGWRDQFQLPDIYEVSDWMNQSKINAGTIYNNDTTDDILNARKTNAGESGTDTSANLLFDVYTFWMRLPVDPKTGKWDEKKNIQSWFLTAWCGDITGQPVCLQLEPNPHWCKEIPCDFFHTHKDDKGAIRMGYSTLMKCLSAMEMTVVNEGLDNIRLLQRAPWLLERGSVGIKDKTFSAGGNRIWWLAPGAKEPTQVKIQNNTAVLIPLVDKIQSWIDRAMGTNKPFLGEALGSRTTAQEAGAVFEQALKPALEDAKFKANQILPFIAKWCMEMTRQFADPDDIYFITRGGIVFETKPTQLWGPLAVRVTAVKRFQDGILRRREEDVFISTIYPLQAPFMGRKGNINFFTQIAKNRGFEHVESWFEEKPDFDARHVARSENTAILNEGIYDLPKQEENHEVHLEEHKPMFATYMVLPPEQINEKNAGIMKMHIQMHEQFLATKTQEVAEGAQQAQANQQQPQSANMDSEAGGDMMSGDMGQMANAPAPQVPEEG